MALSRRALLVGGAGFAGAGLIGCATGPPHSPPGTNSVPPAEPPGTAQPPPVAEPVSVERRYSTACATDVTMITVVPEGVTPQGLPVCVALHGRGGDARWFIDLGLPRLLTEAVRRGVRPFAVVTVDGGRDSYWVDAHPGDPQRMLTDELPGWLASRGCAAPTATMGISMGAFGALRFARGRRDMAAVAVASPALFTDWPDARSRRVFRDERQWRDSEPLRHIDELAGIPVGVWCGTKDPFAKVAREFVALAHPEVAAIDSGAHDADYWRRVLPDMLSFVGARLT
jgi:S-formylglutathione hydrolase FrmB